MATKALMSSINSTLCMKMASLILQKSTKTRSNIVLSPPSIHLMLSLAANGSTGRTLNQFLSSLGAKSLDDLNSVSSRILSVLNRKSSPKDPILSAVNGVWANQNIKPSFEAIGREVYNAKIEKVDFVTKAEQVRNEVNLWAKEATKGLIQDVLQPDFVDSNTEVILANALYFKGLWRKTLYSSDTEHRDFHKLDGKTILVPFMTNDKKHLYGEFDSYKVLKLSYKKAQYTPKKFSMYFILPHEKYGLEDLIQKARSDSSFLTQKFVLKEESLGEFWIPKFKLSTSFAANSTLIELGLDLPFQNLGEFSNMIASTGGAWLDKILHKSVIEVNEEGTEAAAWTIFGLASCALGDNLTPRPSFVADHPFIFMVREETSGLILFIGAVLDPASDS